MGNHYLNAEAEKMIELLQRPGQSLSGVIIEHLKPLVMGHEKTKKRTVR